MKLIIDFLIFILVSNSVFAQIQGEQILLIILVAFFLVVGLSLLWIIQLRRSVSKKTKQLKKEIEKHKITEESLSAERELLQSLMDNIPDTIYFKNIQSRFIKINKAQAVTLGLNHPDKAIMKSDFDFFAKEHASAAFEDEQKIIKSGEPLIDKREKIRIGDGSYRYFSATKVPIFDEKGKVKGIVGMSRDITERIIAEESLRESEAKYRSLFENMVNGFAYFKIQFGENNQIEDIVFIEVNRVFENILGLKRSDLIGETFKNAFPDNKLNLIEIYSEVTQNAEGVSFEYYSTSLKKWLSVIIYSDQAGYCTIILDDITERKSAEEQILKSERKFRSIFDYSSDAIVLLSEEKIIDCNSKAFELFGSKREKILGKTLYDFSPEFQFDGNLSRESITKKIKESLSDKPQFFEWLHSKMDGRLFFAEISLIRIDFAGEKMVQGIIRDISERKRAEEALKQRELEFRSLANNLPDFIARYDREGRYIYVNKLLEDMLGIRLQEITGKTFKELGLSETAFGLEKTEIERVFNTGKINSFEFALQKERRPSLFESRLIPEFGSNNSVSTVLSITRDITEMKRFEEIQNALYKISESVNSTENLQTLYQDIHHSIKELMTAENFYIAIYDSEKEIISYPYWVDKYNPAPEPGKCKNGLTEYVLKNGQEMLVNEKMHLDLIERGEIEETGILAKIWLGIPLKLMDKTFGVLVVQDHHDEKVYGEEEMQILTYVSEQIAIAIDKKRSEEELVRYAAELKELNASKDKFFSIISHDLRSPFHSLLGITEIIAEEGATLSKEEMMNFSKEIHKSLKNQYRLLENLLEWSRFQRGKMEYQPVKINLNEKVVDIINVLIGNAASKKISLVNNVGNNIFIKADQNMIQSVIQNLVSNAIKFTECKGKITVNAVEKDGMVEISVADNGVGIDPKDLYKLFRIDVQFSKLGTAREKGTGLGLNLCKELVEKHGGQIWANSVLGKGTTFTFTIPKDV